MFLTIAYSYIPNQFSEVSVADLSRPQAELCGCDEVV